MEQTTASVTFPRPQLLAPQRSRLTPVLGVLLEAYMLFASS